MKLTSLGQKYSDVEASYAEGKDGEYFPSLYLTEKQIDTLGIENARVGTEMTMISTVRLSSLSESKDGSRSMSFEIVEAAIMPKQDKAEASSILFPND